MAADPNLLPCLVAEHVVIDERGCAAVLQQRNREALRKFVCRVLGSYGAGAGLDDVKALTDRVAEAWSPTKAGSSAKAWGVLLSGVFEQVYLQEMRHIIGRILRAAGSQVEDSRLHVTAAKTLKVVAAEEGLAMDPTAKWLPDGSSTLEWKLWLKTQGSPQAGAVATYPHAHYQHMPMWKPRILVWRAVRGD